MAFKGKIVVDTEKCKGCQVCIPVCPTDVIEMATLVNSKGYHFMEQVREECIGCTNCATVCPDSVITVYRVKV
jgi:2-oxoglutarate ferredoxin oxidoreductase subunit delta